MGYLIIYDKFETSFTGFGVAVLENARNVKIRDVINGEYTLSFILPQNDPKWVYVQPENYVKAEGQLFRVRTYDEVRDSSGKIDISVQCEHVCYDLNNCKFMPSSNMIGATPNNIMLEALYSTPFTIGSVEVTTLTDIILDKTNPAKVLNLLVENVGGELLRDNRVISLLSNRGSDNGVQFRVGKNVVSLKRQCDSKGLITRLYPFGKDDLDITSVHGTAYIDSPFINDYDRVHVGYIDYREIDTPAKLLAAAQAEFSTPEKDGIDKPRVTYQGEVIELKKLKEYGDIEAFSLGDAIRIVDDVIGINTKQRIIEYEYYPFEPQRSSVVLANYPPDMYKKNTSAGILAGILVGQKRVDKIITSAGKVNPSALDNIQNKIQTEINSTSLIALLHSNADVYVDNVSNPTKAMFVGAGTFATADTKKANGDWDWNNQLTEYVENGGEQRLKIQVNNNYLEIRLTDGTYLGKVGPLAQ
jgi:phage minor structural protein